MTCTQGRLDYDYTILHRSPPRLHLHEVAGWTVGAAGILGGRPREAAPAGNTGPRPVCGGEVEGPHEGGEDRTKAPKAARGAATAARRQRGLHKGGEACKKATRAAQRRRRPHEGRQRPHGGSEGCTKAARPARRRRGPHKGAEGRRGGGNGRTEAARAAQKRRGPQEGDEGRRVRVRTDRLVGSATGPLGKALIRRGRPLVLGGCHVSAEKVLC
jgi:hypothetical protein